MKRSLALLLVACVSAGAHAEPSRLAADDYLQCAAHYGAWGYLLKSGGYDRKDELKELDGKVQFYLQIAEAIEAGPLKERFLKASDAEMDRTRALIRSGSYMNYADGKKERCRALVRDHQAEIMERMDKLYDKAR